MIRELSEVTKHRDILVEVHYHRSSSSLHLLTNILAHSIGKRVSYMSYYSFSDGRSSHVRSTVVRPTYWLTDNNLWSQNHTVRARIFFRCPSSILRSTTFSYNATRWFRSGILSLLSWTGCPSCSVSSSIARHHRHYGSIREGQWSGYQWWHLACILLYFFVWQRTWDNFINVWGCRMISRICQCMI